MHESDTNDREMKRWKPTLLDRVEWHLEISPETRWIMWPALGLFVVTIITIGILVFRGGLLLLGLLGF